MRGERVILAFGDSITYGFGAENKLSYPRQIANKTGLKVINAGVNGELSSEGLLRLPLFLKDKPSLVILCHGANDIYNRRNTTEIKDNLLAMIKLIEQSASNILLVGIPDFSILSKDTHFIYNEIAKEKNLLFEENILRNILSNNLTKTDYIHPNADGYEMMADAFIEILNVRKEAF